MKLGIVGNGFIVNVFLETLKDVKSVEKNAICVRSSSFAKGKELACSFGIEKVYTDFDEFLSSQEIDTVYVGVINSLHYEYVKKSIMAGKNVICEKPFTKSYEEAHELFNLADEKGVFLFEAITTLHVPMYKKAKEHLSEIGNVRIVNCSFCQYSSRYDKYLKGEVAPVFRKELFGGALVDLNIYNIHFVVSIFGEPKDVEYFPNFGKNGVDISGVLVLDYGEFKAVCIAAKDSASESFAILQGEKGFIKIGSTLNECLNCTVNTNENNAFYKQEESFGRMYYEITEFERIIREKDNDSYRLLAEESKLVMKVLEKAYSVME